MLERVLWGISNIVDRLSDGKWVRVIYTDGTPYLMRVYLLPRWFRWRPFLHYFFRGDNDRALHNHPWGTSISLILTGGYREERLERECDAPLTLERDFRPGSINIIRADDFHRVTLLGKGCWTLFVAGEREQVWGFMTKEGEYVPWQEYVDGQK